MHDLLTSKSSATFSQAYVLFKTPQAATAVKHKIESFGGSQQYTKKFTVSYTNPYTNPFRTLPKDGPTRNNAPANNNRSAPGSYGNSGAGSTGGSSQPFNSGSSGYRSNRGAGYNNRGGGMNMSGYNRGGFHQPVTGSFQASGMSGFQGSPMGGMQSYGGFQNGGGMMGGMRGGPMGIRGGRGSINSSGMMGMPMTGMGIGAMGGLGMSIPQLNGGMGMQGMQGSHFRPHMDHVGLQEVSASPKGQSLPPIPLAMQISNSSFTSLRPLPIRGRAALPAGNFPSSAWAH